MDLKDKYSQIEENFYEISCLISLLTSAIEYRVQEGDCYDDFSYMMEVINGKIEILQDEMDTLSTDILKLSIEG